MGGIIPGMLDKDMAQATTQPSVVEKMRQAGEMLLHLRERLERLQSTLSGPEPMLPDANEKVPQLTPSVLLFAEGLLREANWCLGIVNRIENNLGGF